jgi:hypothetical protein
VAGPVSDWLGIRVWFIGGGIACILMALVALVIKPIMEIEKNNAGTKPAVAADVATEK